VTDFFTLRDGLENWRKGIAKDPVFLSQKAALKYALHMIFYFQSQNWRDLNCIYLLQGFQMNAR